jgi:mannosyl-glycoprotein endo-beta-N-acetylglucosaminidase
MGKRSFGVLVLFLLFSLSLFPRASSAYTDYSTYRIETGAFSGEDSVKSALETLKQGTGWWATYEPVGKLTPYYQVFSGGFSGEQNVKDKINQFQSSTGLTATYKPMGIQVPYQKVLAGSFYGKVNTERYVQEFQNETGMSATVEPTGNPVYKKRIMSGGFLGEENIKKVLQEFQEQTGILGTYKPTGQYQEALRVVSGGFAGEENVKSILSTFVSDTGINASYEPINYSQYYALSTGGFYGEDNVKSLVNQVNSDLGLAVYYEAGRSANIFYIKFDPLVGDSLKKATNYLDTKGWWYSKTPTDKKIATAFRIVAEPTFDKELINKALNFYKSRNWWATTSPSGQKRYNSFYILSDSIGDSSTLNKGLGYFAKRNWWAGTQTTNEKDYVYFNIVTNPYLEKENIDKAVNYFKKKNWWNTKIQTDKKGYNTFQIVTDPLLGEDKSELALDFFKKNDWWAMSKPTGAKEGYYKIVTGSFQGYDNAAANAKMVTDRFGWWTTTVKIQNGPQVVSTNYNMTISEMVNLQMKLSPPPQTDKYRNEPAYIFSEYVDTVNKQITDNGVNVRKGPGLNFDIVSKLGKGFKEFTILGTEGEWTKVSLNWKNATVDDTVYYLNPNNFSPDSKQYFQFLKLSKPADININEINEKILNANTGILKGTAGAFAEASSLYGVNELYLIAHALHETGNGSSPLATGVKYNNVTVYNMYGYGAYDSCAVECGAKTAYEQGWTSPKLAIIGGAKLIGSRYIYNDRFPQDTLYKMRWNPDFGNYHQQYATDIGWAAKQVNNLYNYYQLLDNYTLYYDLPDYK